MGQSTTATEKYNRKRTAILDAAIPVFTERGLGNTRLSDVGAEVGLKTTSVTYYFKRKEDLAAACYLRTLEEFVALAEEAVADASGGSDSVRLLFDRYFATLAAIRNGERAPFMLFDEVLSLQGELAEQVFAAYADMFRTIRKVVNDSAGRELTRGQATARTHLLLTQLLWVPAWVGRYRTADYQRLSGHMYRLFADGIAPGDFAWIEPETPRFAAPQDARGVFLKAAIETINSSGYSGASVDRIAERLNLTKGSFYHHYDSKDELGIACFQRSFDVVEQALDATAAIDNCCDRLLQLLSNLTHYQLDDAGPLLTPGAMRTLSPELRRDVLDGYQRLADRIADIVIDGIAEGSLRAVDPLLASQMFTDAIIAAHELPRWIHDIDRSNALRLYVKPIFRGALRG